VCASTVPTKPTRAIGLAGWALVGLCAAFTTATVVAAVQLARIADVSWPDPSSAGDIDRFRTVMTSLERDRIVLFGLLAAGALAVGWALLRKRGIGPRFALLGLNALLIGAWAGTEILAINRLDLRDTVYVMIHTSGLSTGLGYTGLVGAAVLLIVDILSLTNPSTDESVAP
jgi:hypothetical protein